MQIIYEIFFTGLRYARLHKCVHKKEGPRKRTLSQSIKTYQHYENQ